MIVVYNYVKGRHVEEGQLVYCSFRDKDQEQWIQMLGKEVPLKQEKALSDGEGCSKLIWVPIE